MRLADLIGGVFVLILGLGVVFFSSQLTYYSEFGPGPGFLPLWVGIIISACGIYVVIALLRKQGGKEEFFKPRARLGLQIFITIIITFLLLPLLGFSIGLALFIGVTMRMMGKHRWALCGLTAIVTAIGIHFIFISWLTIPLPQGLIGW
jgi:putative tricarboxylic transport membrane protein